MNREDHTIYQDNMNHEGYFLTQDLEPVMTVGQWIITAIVMAIPCVNVVMLFVWGFGGGNRNRANYCKAALILWMVAILLAVLLTILGGAALAVNPLALGA